MITLPEILFFFFFFFFNDTATTEIYTLSLHDALPIGRSWRHGWWPSRQPAPRALRPQATPDRKSTRLNSSHVKISYAVFCLKKKKKKKIKCINKKKKKQKNTKKKKTNTK